MSRCHTLDTRYGPYLGQPCTLQANHLGSCVFVAPGTDPYDTCVNCGEPSVNHASTDTRAIKCLFAPTDYATLLGYGSGR